MNASQCDTTRSLHSVRAGSFALSPWSRPSGKIGLEVEVSRMLYSEGTTQIISYVCLQEVALSTLYQIVDTENAISIILKIISISLMTYAYLKLETH